MKQQASPASLPSTTITVKGVTRNLWLACLYAGRVNHLSAGEVITQALKLWLKSHNDGQTK